MDVGAHACGRRSPSSMCFKSGPLAYLHADRGVSVGVVGAEMKIQALKSEFLPMLKLHV